jgi:hypothetical protein
LTEREDRGETAWTVLPGRLKYSWWGSNGPTGGYLASLVLDDVDRIVDTRDLSPRRLDLHVQRVPAADNFERSVRLIFPDSSIAVAMVTFDQGGPFALGSVYFSAPTSATAIAPEDLPPVLPPEAYSEMAIHGISLPPVTEQFHYRPTTAPDGTSPRPGWDVVWVQPRARAAVDRVRVVTLIGCWYLPNYMRAVRRHISGVDPALVTPPATNLLGLHIMFSSADSAFDHVDHGLLASRLNCAVDGHYFEQAELWSERGEFLSAQLVRRDERAPR